MKIAILGASGYIGTSLIKSLLAGTDHQILALSPSAAAISKSSERLEKINCDVFDTLQLHQAIKDCDVLYYLVHMMAQNKYDFADAETRAAHSVVDAIHSTNIKRVIYLGGLGNDNDNLSKHLSSRHHTGEVLRRGDAKVIEFRASMVIGNGSLSYDIITSLVHKLPILTLPAWASTLTQPIALDDAISYLQAAVDVKIIHNEIIEIGGPDKLSYKELMKQYAHWKGRRCVIVDLPLIPVSISAWWLNIFTPKRHAKVGRAMVESLGNPMIVSDTHAKEMFPDVEPVSIHKAFV